MEVVGEAGWGSGQHFDGEYVPLVEANFIDEFFMEEEPEKALRLYRQDELLFYISWYCSDFVSRVFYSHGGKNWARKTEDFLGLVGAEHSEHDGKLKFVELPP